MNEGAGPPLLDGGEAILNGRRDDKARREKSPAARLRQASQYLDALFEDGNARGEGDAHVGLSP